MNQIEQSEQTRSALKRRFIISLVLLIAGIIYAIVPIDIIPDLLGPIGWIDDIGVLLLACLYSWFSYRKLKK
ncbi:MAG: DUF1232 domain-containing protein [Spirochaetes bacterium]|nr:DUF1232 domain-containing protein [Spirochaetota bacterium]